MVEQRMVERQMVEQRMVEQRMVEQRGAADGGAADGGAYDSPPSWSLIEPVPEPPEDHRPWGILKLYDQFESPGLLTDYFDPDRVPMVIKLALRRLQKERIRVAILDTGVDYTHPSLSGKIMGGFDVFTMTPGLPEDDNGHGTHIAGTVCSRLENDPFGLAPPVELYAVKILDRYAMGDLFNIIIGLKWAIDNHMDIVNMSIGYREDSQAIHLAVRKAYEAGVIMIAAAGNHSNWDAPAPVAAADGGAADGGAADGGAADGGAADGGAADGGAADGGAADGGAAESGGAGSQDALSRYAVMYPARYPEVIAVGASNQYGEITAFTNSGEELDLTAPGTHIVSTNVWKWSGFGICSGTSMAVPHVTGTVAMMLAMDPKLSPDKVREILKETADELDFAAGVGVGDLNLTAALKRVWSESFMKAWKKSFKKHYKVAEKEDGLSDHDAWYDDNDWCTRKTPDSKRYKRASLCEILERSHATMVNKCCQETNMIQGVGGK
ncbi:MAG: S8 family peptidase [Deltaproteobacteria bacterium]|nr:S8 family peptidase [Deltaproteobacteria bacterium]